MRQIWQALIIGSFAYMILDGLHLSRYPLGMAIGGTAVYMYMTTPKEDK